MKVYEVGGAVRDRLLGRPVSDRDFVVVGATPEAMLAAGYRPVGRDFPVYLHPETRDEHALARRERKSGRGYRGFVVETGADVTLEQDLARRDITINAMARDESGRIIDPYGGQADLAARRLRHVSPAFVEDPVRILRVARFAARFDFDVVPETLALMRSMVESGEVDALVPERVFAELARALGESKPVRFFEVLRACGALGRILPELERLFGVPQPARHHPEIDTGVHTLMVLDQAALLTGDARIRFAALLHDLGKGETPPAQWPAHRGHEERSVKLIEGLCARLRVPHEYRDLAVLVARYHGLAHRVFDLDAATLLGLLKALDALRRPERLDDFLLACEADARGRTGFETREYPQSARLRTALRLAREVDAGALAAAGHSGPALGAALDAARCARIGSGFAGDGATAAQASD